MKKKGGNSVIPISDYLHSTNYLEEEDLEGIIARMMAETYREAARTAPDTFGADCLFLEYFVTPEMADDFPMIARDYFVHEIANIANVPKVDYLDGVNGNVSSAQQLEHYTLNLMMNSLRNGSEYTRKLFQYLYKTYYGREYRQLKRFSTLSWNELTDLSTNEYGNVSPIFLALNLTMAGVFGITVQPECNGFYVILNRYYADRKTKTDADLDFMDSVMRDYDDSLEEIQELFGTEEEMLRLEGEYEEFLTNALCSLGYPEDFVAYCNTEDYGIEDRLAETLAVLKNTYPKRSFSKKELIAYAGLYEAVNALICSVEETKDWLFQLTGRGQNEEHLPKLEAQKTLNVGTFQTKPEEKKPKKEKAASEPRYREADLLKEIEELQRKVHEQEGSIKALRSELVEQRSLMKEKEHRIAQADAEHGELDALRRHLYLMTEQEEPVSTISIDKMKEELAKLRIVIVGGHSNWTQKLRNLFDKWVFIDPKATGSEDPDVVAKADYVFFFTDTISHGTYYRYIHAAREKRVKFGYLHGVNVEKTVKEIYREVTE